MWAELGIQDVSTRAEVAADRAARSARSEFEALYRANLNAVTAFFARRCFDAQTVADLTAETFVNAIGSFATFDVRRGSVRAWLFGIARRVYADHCAAPATGQDATSRLATELTLCDDEIEHLAARIDDQRAGRKLLERCAHLPELDRAVIELVDIAGLSSKEAGTVLQVSPGAVRVRLFRARPTQERSRQAMTNFDDHLWSYLQSEHGTDRVAAHRLGEAGTAQGTLIARGGAIAAAAVAASLIALGATSATPPALP